jgi:hypothetical protein
MATFTSIANEDHSVRIWLWDEFRAAGGSELGYVA